MSMEMVFAMVLNRSFTAAYCVVVVVLLRFFLQKQPKIFSYLLWSAVLFRLLCPFSISSGFSLLRIHMDLFSMEEFFSPYKIEEMKGKGSNGANYDFYEEIEPDGNGKDGAVYELLPAAAEGIQAGKQIQLFLTVCGWVWLAGAVCLAGYSVRMTLRLRHFLHGAVQAGEKLYEADGISTPFVFGIVHPCIYLPVGLPAKERKYVLEHERVHVARRDYLVKILAWTSVCIHWFNPCVWLAFTLMERDMEMSCDEAVLRKLGTEAKKDYSRALLVLSCKKTGASGCPIAFGEGDVKKRIRNILSYRRQAFVTAALAAALLLAVILGLSLDPLDQREAERLLSFGRKCQFVEDYANAFCKRDGKMLVESYIDETAAFEHVMMLEKVDGEYTFGFSSPWPDGFRYVVREQDNREKALGEIWYYAWTSDPHAAVWKEELVFEEVENRYCVVGGSMKYLDQISSKEEFEEAYWVAGQYDFLDYAETGFVEAIHYQTEYDREQGDGTDRNAVYRNPETAAEWILNLSGGQGTAARSSNGRAVVTYTFADGDSVAIPMYDADYDSGTSFTEAENGVELKQENGAAQEVWIPDLEAWNAL